MAQPPPYDRAFNFADYQAVNPTSPLPGLSVDEELARVKLTLDAVLSNLAIIQRDDTELANNSVGLDQLKDEVDVGFNPPVDWAPDTNYVTRDTVFFEVGLYRCLESHVSSDSFAYDLDAGRWELIVDFASVQTEAIAALSAAIAAQHAAEDARDDAVAEAAAAASSAAAASGSASAAATSETNAAGSASAAEASALAAAGSASVAADREAGAIAAAGDAEQARDAAIAARDAAQLARDDAAAAESAAATSASNAATSESNAADSAVAAENSKDAAEAAADRAEAAAHPSGGSPEYLFLDGTTGGVYDFTNSMATGVDAVPSPVSQVTNSVGGAPLTVPSGRTPPTAVLSNGIMALAATAADSGLATTGPLLPSTGEFTLAWSHKADSEGAKAVIWQHQAGQVGRTQITANAKWTGSGVSSANGMLQIYINGVADGSGPSGMIATVVHPIGEWSDFVLVIRDGSKNSSLFVNGELVDRFTRPSSFPSVDTALFSHAAQSGSGLLMGRLLCLRRAPLGGEISLIRQWVRSSFTPSGQGQAWVDPVVTASAAVARSKPVPGFDSATLWSKEGSAQLRPASTTKLMTAHVGLTWLKRLGRMNDTFTRTLDDDDSGSGANLNVGDTLDVPNALANMGLASSNVTANMWARVIGDMIQASEGGDGGLARFVSEMNVFSSNLGMTGSAWVNPTGVDADGHIATANDMAVLCAVAAESHAEISSIWSKPVWTLVITGPDSRTINITNTVDPIENGDSRMVWGKTGTTPLGGNCLIGEMRAPKGNRYFYAAFGSTSDAERYQDAMAVHASVTSGMLWAPMTPERVL